MLKPKLRAVRPAKHARRNAAKRSEKLSTEPGDARNQLLLLEAKEKLSKLEEAAAAAAEQQLYDGLLDSLDGFLGGQ